MTSAEQREDTHDVIAHKYIYLWGMAIHKQFFKYYTVALGSVVTVSVAILCLTNWWWLLASTILSLLFIRAWYIGWPVLAISLVGGYIYIKVRRTHQREEQIRKASDDKVRLGLEKLGGDVKNE